MNIAGVILDSEPNSLGLLNIGDETVIEKQVREMKKVCHEVILVSSQPSLYLPILHDSIRVITNYYKGSHQLSSLHAALSLTKSDLLWVVTSDMPFVSVDALQILLQFKNDKLDLVVPEIDGNIQLFHAIYDKTCLHVTSQLIEEEHTNMLSMFENTLFKVVEHSVFKERNVHVPFLTKVKSEEDYMKVMQVNQ